MHPKGDKCINCLGVDKNNMHDVDPKCHCGPGQKCPNCIDEKSKLQGGTIAKHIPFDSFIGDMLKKCMCKTSNSKC